MIEFEETDVLTYREFLTITLVEKVGVPLTYSMINDVEEAVASVALDHPEYDMDERRTLADWRAAQG